MPRNNATFWNVRAMRAHLEARLTLERDAALLRLIKTVDDVEHRGFAGAIRPDDGANFPFTDVKGDVAHRVHAAERQRDILHRQEHLAGGDLRSVGGSHAACPSTGAAATICISRIFTRALIVPLRPSSKVTSVEMSASLEPS